MDFVSQNVMVNGKHYKVIYYPQVYDRLYCLMRPIDKIADAKRDITSIDVRDCRCRYFVGCAYQSSHWAESYQSD